MWLLVFAAAYGAGLGTPAPVHRDTGCGTPAGSAATAADCALKVATAAAAAGGRAPSAWFAFGGPYSLCYACEAEVDGVPADGFDMYRTADFKPTPAEQPSGRPLSFGTPPSAAPARVASPPARSAPSPSPPHAPPRHPPPLSPGALGAVYPASRCGSWFSPEATGARLAAVQLLRCGWDERRA